MPTSLILSFNNMLCVGWWAFFSLNFTLTRSQISLENSENLSSIVKMIFFSVGRYHYPWQVANVLMFLSIGDATQNFFSLLLKKWKCLIFLKWKICRIKYKVLKTYDNVVKCIWKVKLELLNEKMERSKWKRKEKKNENGGKHLLFSSSSSWQPLKTASFQKNHKKSKEKNGKS